MEALDVDMGVATDGEEAVPELGDLAWEWTWVACEGVVRRDTVDKHGEGENGKVEGDEEAQRCCNDHGTSGSGGEKGDERGREEEARSLGANGVRLVAAKDLVSDLAKTTGGVTLVAVPTEHHQY